MTYFKDSFISFCCLITAAFFMLLIWPALAYIALTLIVIYSAVKTAQNHPQTTKLLGQFVAEFVGFGLVIFGFVSIFVFMGMFFV